MEKLRKSGRARIGAAAAAAVAVGVFASLGATGYAARIVGFAHTSPVAAQYPPAKVTICHHTHSQTNPFVTITVSVHALPAHLRHGDTIGPCPEQAPPANQVAPVKKQKVHKAHKAKHSADRSKLHGHFKAAKVKAAKKSKSHGHSSTHGHSNAPATGAGTVHGNGQGQSKAHGQGKGHDSTNGHGQGKGHTKTHGSGQNQSKTHGSGQGLGNGHGQGSGDTHGGNSGGGKGNGHK
jgi:hypothetical protein